MKIQAQTFDRVLVLHVSGRLDSTSSPDLERSLTDSLDSGAINLIFDLSDLDYISSAGLRVVLLAAKRLRTVQGRMVLVGMRDVVQEVFEMSGFLALFAVAETVEIALHRL